MAKEFTIMFLSKKSGRHFSVKMNLLTMILFAVFLICLICITGVSFKSYIDMLQKNESSRSLVKQLENDVEKLKKVNREAYLYKLWADRIIYRRINFEDATGKGTSGLPTDTLDGEVHEEPLEDMQSLLDIDEFDVTRINLGLDFEFSFNLINRSSGKHTLAGYIFVVASNNEVKPEIYESWPRVENLSGMPKDFKKGTKFAIRYMRNVKGRINQPDIGPKFNRVDLIAYSEDGNIIMKRGFYIERYLKESPFE